MLSVRVIALFVALGFIAVPATVAQSATVTVTTQNPDGKVFLDRQGLWGQRLPYVTYTNSALKNTDETYGRTATASAGMFRLTATGADRAKRDFLAFCLSPFTRLDLSVKSYVYDSKLFPKAVVKNLSALANGAWKDMQMHGTAAGAFQLAVWEIISETQKPFSLSDGNFHVVLPPSIAQANIKVVNAQEIANKWLMQLGSGSFRSDPKSIEMLSADATQDLLTNDLPAPVPLPGSLGFLAVGLAALAAKSRARRA